MLRQSRAGFSRISISPNRRLIVIFFCSSHSPHSEEHLETHEVRKKFARSRFHTQEITQGTWEMNFVRIPLQPQGARGGQLAGKVQGGQLEALAGGATGWDIITLM